MPQPERDGLHGVRVALLEARMGTELAELVRRYGGVVRSAPAVREAPLDCADAVGDFLTAPGSARPPCVRISHRRRRGRALTRGRAPESAAVRSRSPAERNNRLPRTKADGGFAAIWPETACINGVALYQQRDAGCDGSHRSGWRGSHRRPLRRARRGARRRSSPERSCTERTIAIRMAIARRHRPAAGSRS